MFFCLIILIRFSVISGCLAVSRVHSNSIRLCVAQNTERAVQLLHFSQQVTYSNNVSDHFVL